MSKVTHLGEVHPVGMDDEVCMCHGKRQPLCAIHDELEVRRRRQDRRIQRQPELKRSNSGVQAGNRAKAEGSGGEHGTHYETTTVQTLEDSTIICSS